MSSRHIEQHYGFGAARLAIRAEMHRVSDAGLAADFGAMFAEAGSGGPGAIARRFAGTVLGVGGTLAFLAFVITALVHEEAKREALEVVMLETAQPLPLPPVVEPMIEEVIPPEPVVPPAPEPVAPEPKPEPPKLAEVKPPPPPPVKPPEPVKPKVEPVRIEPELAKVTPPPVAPRVERSLREKPLPIARPRVQIEAVAVARERNVPAIAPERVARAAVRPETRAMPRMDAPAAPAIDLPSESAPQRAFRVAAAHAPSAPRGRAIPGINPVGVAGPAIDAPSARSAPTRGGPVARPAAPAASRAVPRFEMAAAPTSPPPSLGEVPGVATRTGRATPLAAAAQASNGRSGVSGVPLGELAACVTDQEEDRLKRAVVAAVKTQGECVSSKGIYRFVETKNLNAFLMWIDRTPSRRAEDRCAELRYALECLQGRSRRASR